MDNKGYVNEAKVNGGGVSQDTEAASCKSSSLDFDDNLSGSQVKRDQWGKDIEFLLSCIALSVGLGNVWRFPFVALENGGGAFVIPYIIVLFLVGKPIYYMEMLLGQFSSRGSVKLYDFAPIMRGVGFGQVISVAILATYYATLMALTCRYLIASFSSVLPWSYCRPEWGDSCIDSGFKGNFTVGGGENDGGEVKKYPSAQFYFTQVILKEKDQIDDGIGMPSWQLTICLLFTWIMIAIIIIKGVRSSGKASYFLAIFPYVVMFILLIRAMTLPGASKGVMFFITPQWDMLFTAKVWYAAVTQVFFSLAICFGNIVIYSSYNKFEHNVYRDANVVTTLDTFTSMLSGVIIFGILGNLAYETQTDDIANVVKGGTGLAFISYPDAIAKFNAVPQLFSVLFFLMLFVLGLGSNVGIVSCLLTVTKDQFPNVKQWAIVGVISVCGFCIGLLYITPGGQFILNLLDFYGVTFIILCLAIVQLITVGWIYGVKRFCADIEFMLQRKTSLYYRLCWAVITPAFMTAILIYTLVNYEPIKYNGYTFTMGLQTFGWCLSAFGISQVLIWGVSGYLQTPPGPSRFMRSFQPKSDWGPTDRRLLKLYQNNVIDLKRNEPVRKNFLYRIWDNIFG
ncbi:sodium-dependent nutrient amino acid transporter 1-like [Eupeodes corollae]|uniref:sodium-dependent nutrient amino acid transporter 1-like n=1 Tax=Eupeodes corollae TaxID=290404 RepID=UPI002493B25E|nr:sodium-dependent nutrient amino acid transporter 1-like [Eupeodes corollae]XP_055904336.1 sodium-dependent nutrient amino acid transporter 1-like [Eupeodes corollae]